jgi:hypothetical protein
MQAQEKESLKKPTVIVRDGLLIDGRSGKDYLTIGENDVLVSTVTVEGRVSGPSFTFNHFTDTVIAEGIQYTLVQVHGRDTFIPKRPYEYIGAIVSEENGATISYGNAIPKKRYVQKEQTVGFLNEKEIPLPLLLGAPFVCSSLNPIGSIVKPITIRISDAKGPLLIPADSSLVPVNFEPFEFFVCAVGVTWKFTKKGISFETIDETFFVEKEGAKVVFTKEGISLEGIKRIPKKRS